MGALNQLRIVSVLKKEASVVDAFKDVSFLLPMALVVATPEVKPLIEAAHDAMIEWITAERSERDDLIPKVFATQKALREAVSKQLGIE